MDLNYYFTKMKKVKYILSLTIGLIILSCFPTSNLVEQKPFDCEISNVPLRDFKVDGLGALYILDIRNQLSMLDPNMQLQYEYFNNSLGDLTYFDTTNPRKIILFYADFQKLIFLDNTLSEIGRVDIEYNFPYDVRAIGSSRDDKLWIYDATDYRLKKVDNDGSILLQSNPMETFLEISFVPDYIIEYKNNVYMIKEGTGVAVFDNFGNYVKYIGCENCYSIQFGKEMMIYLQDQVMSAQSIVSAVLPKEEIKNMSPGITQAFLFERNIYYLEGQCLKKLSID